MNKDFFFKFRWTSPTNVALKLTLVNPIPCQRSLMPGFQDAQPTRMTFCRSTSKTTAQEVTMPSPLAAANHSTNNFKIIQL